MNLKSFILKTDTGIHTVTNLEIEKKLVHQTHAFTQENRRGELTYKGYLDNPKYSVEDDYSKVYSFNLITKRGNVSIPIKSLSSEEEGKDLINTVWQRLLRASSKKRMVDISS